MPPDSYFVILSFTVAELNDELDFKLLLLLLLIFLLLLLLLLLSNDKDEFEFRDEENKSRDDPRSANFCNVFGLISTSGLKLSNAS